MLVGQDLIARKRLREWLEFAGQCIGPGDSRPEKSGSHGRFRADVLDPVADWDAERQQGV